MIIIAKSMMGAINRMVAILAVTLKVILIHIILIDISFSLTSIRVKIYTLNQMLLKHLSETMKSLAYLKQRNRSKQ